MRKWLFVAILMALSTVASADTYRFGMQLVTTGDSTSKLLSAGGKPDQITPIENDYGARIGERWIYFRDGKTITFSIDANGRVTNITEVR